MMRRFLRRVISAALQANLRRRARDLPAPDPAEVLLVVAPHPDDESLGCARFIAAHAARGGTVHLVWITDGEASHPSVSPEELRRIRRAEADAAAQTLGVGADRRHHLGAPDGRLDRLTAAERESVVDALVHLLNATQATVVLVTSALDGSTEHAAAQALLTEALARSAPNATRQRFAYLVWAHWNIRALARIARHAPAVCWRPDPTRSPLRAAALAAYASQTRAWSAGEAPLLSAHFLACFPANGEFYLPF